MTVKKGNLAKTGISSADAGTNIVVYTVSADATFATVNLRICSAAGNTEPVKLRVYRSETDVPVESTDTMEQDVTLNYGSVLERTCLIMSPNERIIVKWISGSIGTISIQVDGLEQG